MSFSSAPFKNSGSNKALFILSIITVLFWLAGKSLNIYSIAFFGAVFELLWLPMIIAVFIGPVLSIILFVKDKYNPKSLAFYTAILQFITLFILIFFERT